MKSTPLRPPSQRGLPAKPGESFPRITAVCWRKPSATACGGGPPPFAKGGLSVLYKTQKTTPKWDVCIHLMEMRAHCALFSLHGSTWAIKSTKCLPQNPPILCGARDWLVFHFPGHLPGVYQFALFYIESGDFCRFLLVFAIFNAMQEA